MESPFYTVGKKVLFVHWPVDRQRLRSFVPSTLEIDTFDGSAWVTAVAYRVTEARFTAVKATPIRDFPQLNFRTYVRLDGDPGVYFFTLDTSDILGGMFGKLIAHLPFRRAKMEMAEDADGTISFRSRRTEAGSAPTSFDVEYRPHDEEASPSEPGSLDEFLVERYRYFAPSTSLRDRLTNPDEQVVYVGDISHESWRLQGVDVEINRNTLFKGLGMETPITEPRARYTSWFDSTVELPRKTIVGT